MYSPNPQVCQISARLGNNKLFHQLCKEFHCFLSDKTKNFGGSDEKGK